MNCVRCGQPLREGATFCTNCGLPAAPPSAGVPDASSTISSDPTRVPSGASGPAVGAYDPTIAVRPPAPPGYAAPAAQPVGTGDLDPTVAVRPPSQPGYAAPPGPPAGSGGFAPVPAVPLDAPTIASSPLGPSPYGSQPFWPEPSLYGSPAYGAPSQPYPPIYPMDVPLAPPPPPPPPVTLRLFGPDADALNARPSNGLQAWLLRRIPLNYVVSKWFMGVAGALVALAVGLILTFAVQFLLGNGLLDLLGISDTMLTGGDSSIANSLFNPSVLNFFAWEHQVTLTLHVTISSQTENLSYTFPLLGLLLVPALALTLGGYLAAASDFHRHPRYSIARGALIGPFYAILLLLLAFASSTTLDPNILGLGSSGTATLGPNVLQECLFGLLWGTLFGALGGWIQLTGSRFLKAALPSLQTLRHSRVAGALTGAAVALACGILLFTGFEFAYFAYGAANTARGGGPLSAGGVPTTGLSIWTVLRQGLTLGPGAAIWLFALGTGAPISTTLISTGSASISSSFGFIGATQSPGSNSLVYLFALGPLIAYIVGGRVAARVARAQRTGDAFIAGALMAVPLCLLMGLATLLTVDSVNASPNGSESQTFTESIGPSFWPTLLAVLVAGAIVGGIGGASALVAPQLGALPRLLLTPLRPLGFLLNRLLDKLTAHPAGQPRSEATKWFYDSVLLAVILAAILLILIPAAPALASTPFPFPVLRGIMLWVATLLVGLPLLFLIGSLVVSFSAPPPLPAAQPLTVPAPQALAVPPDSSPMMAPPSQPFSPQVSPYGTGQLPVGVPGAPGSQPYPPAGMPSQPYPPAGAPVTDASIVSNDIPTTRSSPYPPPGVPGDITGITSADTPTTRSSQPYPPGAPGSNGEPPATQ